MVGPIGCDEMSVRNYQSMLRKMPEKGRSHVHRGESLISRILWKPEFSCWHKVTDRKTDGRSLSIKRYVSLHKHD